MKGCVAVIAQYKALDRYLNLVYVVAVGSWSLGGVPKIPTVETKDWHASFELFTSLVRLSYRTSARSLTVDIS